MLSLNVAGGGARGVIQLGMLKAFQELGIKPDLVYGSSVGALNACLYIQGELDKAEELWLNINNDKVYRFHFWTLPCFLTNTNYLFDSTPLRSLIDKYVNHKKLVESGINFQITATNLTDWTTESYSPKDLTEEEFKSFLMASASPPFAFKPVLWRGKLYADGGVINNFNIINAIKDGANTIIIMTPTVREETKMRNGLDAFNLLTSLPSYCYLDRDLATIDKINRVQEQFDFLREIKPILIRPPRPTGIDLLNFNYGKEAASNWIRYGHDLAKGVLSDSFPS